MPVPPFVNSSDWNPYEEVWWAYLTYEKWFNDLNLQEFWKCNHAGLHFPKSNFIKLKKLQLLLWNRRWIISKLQPLQEQYHVKYPVFNSFENYAWDRNNEKDFHLTIFNKNGIRRCMALSDFVECWNPLISEWWKQHLQLSYVSQVNPHATLYTRFYSQEVTVWWGFTAFFNHRPLLFEEIRPFGPHTCSVNSFRHADLLERFAFTRLQQNRYFTSTTVTQDGAAPHIGRRVQNILR